MRVFADDCIDADDDLPKEVRAKQKEWITKNERRTRRTSRRLLMQARVHARGRGILLGR